MTKMSLRIIALIAIILTTGPFLKARAAQTALISAPKAYVYADMHLKAPIGYIKKGKLVKVGEKERKFGSLLPIAVAGRIAYIQKEDITLLKDADEEELEKKVQNLDKKSVREHVFYNTLTQKIEKDLAVESFLTAKVSNQSLSGNYADLATAVGESETPSGAAFHLYYEKRPQYKAFSYALGLGYVESSGNLMAFNAFDVEFLLGLDLWKTSLMVFDVHANLALSPQSTLELKNSTQSPQGTSYLWGLGADLRFFPESWFQLTAGAAYSTRSFFDDNQATLNGGAGTVTLEGIKSLELILGLSIRI